jgi:hypothetical protein
VEISILLSVNAASRHHIEKVRSIQSLMKQDLIAFLDEQNRRVYFPHQLQSLLNDYEAIYSSTGCFYNRNVINFVSIPRIIYYRVLLRYQQAAHILCIFNPILDKLLEVSSIEQ